MKRLIPFLMCLAVALGLSAQGNIGKPPSGGGGGGSNRPATTLKVDGQSTSFSRTVGSAGGQLSFSVTTNASTYSVTGLPSWCTLISKGASGFKINVKPNTGSYTRQDNITVSAGRKSLSITIKQSPMNSSGTNSGEPTATVTNVTTSQNVTRNGQSGMNVSFTYTVRNLRGGRVKAVLYFYDSDGNNMYDSNDNWVKVYDNVLSVTSTPQSFSRTVFVPYSDLTDSGNLKYDITIFDDTEDSIIYDHRYQTVYVSPSYVSSYNSGGNASATVSNVTTSQNVTRNGQTGMNITYTVNIRNLNGGAFKTIIYMRDGSGSAMYDSNDNWVKIYDSPVNVSSNNATFTRTVFVPYSDLTQRGSLQFDVTVTNNNGGSIIEDSQNHTCTVPSSSGGSGTNSGSPTATVSNVTTASVSNGYNITYTVTIRNLRGGAFKTIIYMRDPDGTAMYDSSGNWVKIYDNPVNVTSTPQTFTRTVFVPRSSLTSTGSLKFDVTVTNNNGGSIIEDSQNHPLYVSGGSISNSGSPSATVSNINVSTNVTQGGKRGIKVSFTYTCRNMRGCTAKAIVYMRGRDGSLMYDNSGDLVSVSDSPLYVSSSPQSFSRTVFVPYSIMTQSGSLSYDITIFDDNSNEIIEDSQNHSVYISR